MNIQFIKESIEPQRQEEIKKGLNAATRNPIYVVLDLQEHFMSGHNDYSGLSTNYKEKEQQFGYLWHPRSDEPIFVDVEPDSYDVEYEAVTRFWTDRFIAIFLTRQAAKDYLQYQSHNLSDEAYIYTFSPGCRNQQMEKLLSDDF